MNKKTRPLALYCFAGLLSCLFSSALADDFLVSNLDDSGPGSLRQALLEANALPGPHLVEFQADLAGTITLASPLPAIEADMDIAGPDSGLVTVSGDGSHRPFQIEEDVSASISHLTISNGFADLGAAIVNLGELTLSNLLVTGNTAESGGGGISNEGALTISHSIISMNTAITSGFGGGIENFGGSITIIDSMVLDNTATFGAGIDNNGDLLVLRSTFADNQGGLGGAMGNTGTLLVINSTLSGNSADTGGGIDNFGGQVELLHVTIANNAASEAGGGIWTDTQFTAKNSLVVTSLSGGDCFFDDAGPPNVLGDNLDTDGSCTGFQSVSHPALDLQPLADNGGPTLTHALSSDSAALDGVSDCTAIDGTTVIDEDQRGVSRPQNQGCDIGAYELEEPSGDVIFADAFIQE